MRRTKTKVVKGEKYDEAKIHFTKGNSFFKKGELEEALSYFKKARKLDPDNDEYIERYKECKSAVEERRKDRANDDDDDYTDFEIAYRTGPTDGEDVTIVFKVSYEDAMSGKKTFRIRLPRTVRCIKCNGRGKTGGKGCDYCMGSGTNLISERINFMVPPGAQDMLKLCLPGKGGPGFRGGRDGFLFIVLRVAEPEKKKKFFGF